MSEKKKVKINGFVFTDEAEAEQAKKEAHGIHYVEERADMHHPETVLEIYNNSDILPISVTHPVLEESLRKKLRISAKNRASEKKASKKTDGYRKKYEITLFISVILAVSVIGMFIVASTSDSPTIINYENKLIDKYAAWEQELDEREAALKEREQTVEEP